MAINYKALELRLRKIVEKRLEEGWELDRGPWRGDGFCCAVGAAAIEGDPFKREFSSDLVARRVLGLKGNDVYQISDGFEGQRHSQRKTQLERIGERIYRDYVVSK